MLPIIHPQIDDYLASVRQPRDEILLEMEKIAEENDFPIIGPDVGMLLYILAKTSNAKRVLELGSGYGYSALWFARAMSDGGLVLATDADPANKQKAETYFRRAGLAHMLRFELGDALQVAANLDGPFDVVFNDIDKEDYPRTIALAAEKLRPGGLFLTDNTLWYGKVAEKGEPDATTQGVLAFNEAMTQNTGMFSLILPLRDGLTVAMKK